MTAAIRTWVCGHRVYAARRLGTGSRRSSSTLRARRPSWTGWSCRAASVSNFSVSSYSARPHVSRPYRVPPRQAPPGVSNQSHRYLHSPPACRVEEERDSGRRSTPGPPSGGWPCSWIGTRTSGGGCTSTPTGRRSRAPRAASTSPTSLPQAQGVSTG